jgi:hypothetical protein
MNSTATTATDPIAAIASDLDLSAIWRLTTDQYHAMAQAGILDEDDPIELLDGYLVTKFRKTPGHVLAKRQLRDAIAALLSPRWFVGSQDPLITHDSVPEPDLTVVGGTYRDYATHHPGPGDIAIVVEVADASLHRDQTLKRRIGCGQNPSGRDEGLKEGESRTAS